MILKQKIAVVYGAGGAIGSAVARAFAREGAKVFLAGRTLSALERVRADIAATGGSAECAPVDALDEPGVDRQVAAIIEQTGRLDISFNATGIPQAGVQGVPLLDLSPEALVAPLLAYTRANFLTARAAARVMTARNAGVILMLTASPARLAPPLVGGMAPAWAALESLSRDFAREAGAKGVRVLCLRADALPETPTIDTVFQLHADAAGIAREQFQAMMAGMTLLQRLPKLEEVANTAAFLASDWAGGMTGTVANVSCGSVVD